MHNLPIFYSLIQDCCPNLQDFTLDMYFRQFWQDPRLSFEKREGLEKLVVGAEYINLIWVPDTFFVNEKTAYFHKATTENQFLRILHTGEILRSIRYFSQTTHTVQNINKMQHWNVPNVLSQGVFSSLNILKQMQLKTEIKIQ